MTSTHPVDHKLWEIGGYLRVQGQLLKPCVVPGALGQFVEWMLNAPCCPAQVLLMGQEGERPNIYCLTAYQCTPSCANLSQQPYQAWLFSCSGETVKDGKVTGPHAVANLQSLPSLYFSVSTRTNPGLGGFGGRQGAF